MINGKEFCELKRGDLIKISKLSYGINFKIVVEIHNSVILFDEYMKVRNMKICLIDNIKYILLDDYSYHENPDNIFFLMPENDKSFRNYCQISLL